MRRQTQSQKLKTLNALLVQNNPKLLQKTTNIQECRKMLNDPSQWVGLDTKEQFDSIDIIVFPEMAFTGYNFQHYEHVLPMACFVDQGEDFEFAREICKKFNVYVLFGYVQKILLQKQGQVQKYELFNAAAMINREGKLIMNTRKSHLYFCDELWSREGDGFKTVQIVNKSGQAIHCSVGICMDINEKNFTSGEYQLANFILKTKAQCLLFVSNWTDNSPTTNHRNQLIRMLNYWLQRLSPLLQKDQPQRLFLICDRVGSEYNFYDKKQTYFFGCSGGLNLNPPTLYQVLDKKKQACIFIKGNIPSSSK